MAMARHVHVVAETFCSIASIFARGSHPTLRDERCLVRDGQAAVRPRVTVHVQLQGALKRVHFVLQGAAVNVAAQEIANGAFIAHYACFCNT